MNLKEMWKNKKEYDMAEEIIFWTIIIGINVFMIGGIIKMFKFLLNQ